MSPCGATLRERSDTIGGRSSHFHYGNHPEYGLWYGELSQRGTRVDKTSRKRADRVLKKEGSERRARVLIALRAAFPNTIPILAGFLFLGMTYGIYMHGLGFPFVYPMLMAMTIFAGSLEFVIGNMLVGAFDPLQAFAISLMINARHIFYGLSMLERYRGYGWRSVYLIFGMCDESFSINYAVDAPEGVDEGWFMFFVTLLDQVYWVLGATLGGLLGNLLAFDTKGLDFVMTALFVVIFLDRWLKEESHVSSVLGLVLTTLCLVAFGSSSFVVASMVAILAALTLMRPKLDRRTRGTDARGKVVAAGDGDSR